MRAPVVEPSGVTSASASASGSAATSSSVREAVDRREPSGVVRPEPSGVVRPEPSGVTRPEPPARTIVEEPPPPPSYAWLWLVGGGALLAVAVLMGPQLLGSNKPPPDPPKVEKIEEPPPDPETVTAEPEKPPPVVLPVTNDPAVIVARAELAANQGHWTLPQGDNVAEHLTALAAIESGHEAITRLRKKAADALLPRGAKELEAKHADLAAEAYRELLAVWPDNKDAVAPLSEALAIQARIVRHMKVWDELLTLADEMVKVNPKSFEGHLFRGQALAGMGRWEDAVAALKSATEIKPKDKTASAALAEAKKKAGGK
jgi:hypothetical protein